MTRMGRYQVRISHATEDADWDTFVAQTPGGRHVQSALWAQVKAVLGWHAARVLLTQDGQMVAGAQMLIRRLPLIGAVGYVSRGPLLTLDDPELMNLVINGLHQLARAHRVQYLVVQPPCNGEPVARQLCDWGFRSSAVPLAPIAMLVVDLTREHDDMLARMTRRTRQYIRHGLREGITVREGTERDLRTFYHMLLATAPRKNWSLFSEDYYLEMWRLLRPHGHVRLFLAEYAGEVVSAIWIIPFGDFVFGQTIVSSDRHGNLGANELLVWTSLKWAKSQGHRYFDFGRIDLETAKIIRRGEPLANSAARTSAFFRLRLGGQLVFCPGAYDYVYNPFLRWAYVLGFPIVANSSVVMKVIEAVRGLHQ